jgi:hypothetical protein
MMKQTGVGGCGGGCGTNAQILVPKRCVLERQSPTPPQAAKISRDAGTYGNFVTDVPVQGPTNPDMRAFACWWKDNVLDKVTDNQGAVVPRWTQHSLCIGNRLVQSGIGGVGEVIQRTRPRVGALSAPPATAPTKSADAESQWVVATLTQLNNLILKAGNKPCASWPANVATNVPAAVACFQGWFNLNAKGSLRTDGTLDDATLCALVDTTTQHAADFPTPYPGTLHCGGLSLYAKIGIGVAAVAVVGGAAAAVAAHKKTKRGSTPSDKG